VGWKFGTLSVAVAIAYASLPLLHSLSPLAAPLAFTGLAYAWIFFVTSVAGTDGGAPFWIASAAALGILLVGPERILTTVMLGLIAVALVLLSHLVLPRDGGLIPPGALFVNFTTNIVASSIFLYGLIFYAVRQMARAEEIAEREQQRSESLLVNILPASVAERLKQRSDAAIADAYPEASILFADMAGSTASASDISPEELVRFLNRVFTSLDALVERHGLEKIKTNGDSYMVVSGVPEPRGDHAAALADLALDMRDALADLRDPKGRPMPVRIGLRQAPWWPESSAHASFSTTCGAMR
jgi:adenylate cyclase